MYIISFIATTDSHSPQSDTTGVVIGSVAGLLSVIVIVTGVVIVMVTYLVLRCKKREKK